MLDRVVERRRCPRGRPIDPDPLGQMLGRDRLARVGERDGSLDLVLELADVAGKRVRAQARHRLGRDRRHGAPRSHPIHAEEILGQRRDVPGALAERGQVDREDVKPIEEILPERAGRRLGLEVGVRRRDHAHVHAPRGRLADAPQLAFLDHAQQPELHRRRHLADLVQEDRAAVRLLEQPAAVRRRAGERAARVAEELGLQQRLRQRPAVLGDEGPGAASAVVVDQPREELLARSRLPGQQDRRVAVEHLARELGRRAQAAVGADQRVEDERARAHGGQVATGGVVGDFQLVPQPRVLAAERVALGGPADDEHEVVRLPGLRHEVVDAPGVDRFHETVDVGVRGEDDADGLRRVLLASPQQLHAGHARHPVVGDDDGDVLGAQEVQRRLAARRAHDAELRRQDRLQRVEDPDLVVDDEDGRRRHAGPDTAVTAGFLPRIS